MTQFNRPLVVRDLNFFAAPNGRRCGVFRGGGIGEQWGRMVGVGEHQ